MKIVYMHHAERHKNEDDNITERGIRHISLFSEMAKDVKFDAIFSSMHLRCRRTADIVNQYHNLEIIEDGKWHKINVELYFNLPAFQLLPKESKEIELNWEDGYGKLTKGEYRIIKDVDYEYEEGRYESFYIAVEFTIE